jgi:hypothetical protein
MAMAKLEPGCWTPLSGTHLVVRWDGGQEIAVYQRGGIWDLSPLAACPGYVLGWIALVNHPELGPWPLVPLTVSRRRLYQTGMATKANLARQPGVPPISSADDLVQPGMFTSDAELDEFLTERRRTKWT